MEREHRTFQPNPNEARELENLDRSHIENLSRLQSTIRGNVVRKQVRVKPVAPGIVHTRIHRPPEGTRLVGEDQRPGEIMKNMTVGDTYDRLRVEQGAGNGGVKVTPKPGFQPEGTDPDPHIKSPSQLANDKLRDDDPNGPKALTANTAVINGGFFQHIPQFRDYGKSVGPTKGREDSLPIPKPYRNDYRTLNVDNEVGISSGPKLESSQGKKKKFEDDRFQRDNQNQDEYAEVGNLNHASDKNPRAAISIFPPKNEVPGDVIMHTLTTGNAPRGGIDHRPRGATMREWQDITTEGSYQYKPDKKKAGNITQRKQRPSTLNLDGGGSVSMGITRGNEPINQIASEKPNPTEVSNIIFAGGGQENEGKKISIERIKG